MEQEIKEKIEIEGEEEQVKDKKQKKSKKSKKDKKEKKSKKDKKSKAEDGEEEEEEELQAIDFSKIKKKKKKKEKKKKDKKKKEEMVEEEPMMAKPELDPNWVDPYTYDELLKRVNDILRKNNTYSSQTTTFSVKPILLKKAARQKYRWLNFREFSEHLNRNPEHLSAFISAEIGITVNLADEKLIMEGRAIEKSKVMQIAKKYIFEYVKCSMCGSIDTILEKDTNTRLLMMVCKSCHSKKSVAQIKSGLGAVRRR